MKKSRNESISKEGINELIKKSSISAVKKEKILEEINNRIKREKTMKLSIKEGSAASVMSGFTETYVTPYALDVLKASPPQIAFLSSFPGLIAPISQLFGSRLMEKYSRKKIIFPSIIAHGLMWLPILFLSFFFWKGLYASYLPLILIVFYSIYAIFGAIGGPAWFSLLGDIVPEKIRGRYFSKRNRICGAVALVSMVIAAFILDFFKTKGLVLLGFSIIFSVALIARLVSAYLFSKHYDPKFKLEQGYYFSFWQFIKKAPKNNFGKFSIYIALINFATMIAGPFFAVYMLRDLHFSYITFMIVNVAGALFMLLFFPLWGKFSDKYGNRQLLFIGSIFIPILPILWIFSKSPVYLILVPQFLSGLGWASFNLAASNFIYDSVTPQRRAICISYHNLLSGIGIFLGAILGGLLAAYTSITFMNKLLFIFLVSGILRALVSVIMLPKIKEVRTVREFNASHYIKSLMMHNFAVQEFNLIGKEVQKVSRKAKNFMLEI